MNVFYFFRFLWVYDLHRTHEPCNEVQIMMHKVLLSCIKELSPEEVGDEYCGDSTGYVGQQGVAGGVACLHHPY